MLNVRNYRSDDYQAIKALYLQSGLYGGQFDVARDSEERLAAVTKADPQSILVYEERGKILGTVSLIENGRVAWLFRFAVEKTSAEKEILKTLYEAACDVLRSRGHDEVLVYSPLDNESLDQRYADLGMNKGGAYSCFWQSLKP